MERFAEVSEALARRPGWQVLGIGGREERRAMERAGFRGRILAGELSLAESAAAIRSADLLISNDSGPMHMADAVGTPVVAIFGPLPVELAEPRHVPRRILTGGAACEPCCPHPMTGRLPAIACRDRSCLSRVSVEAVLEAVDSLLCARSESLA